MAIGRRIFTTMEAELVNTIELSLTKLLCSSKSRTFIIFYILNQYVREFIC